MFGGDADLEPVKVDVGCGLVWARIPDMLEPLPGLSWKPQPGICCSSRQEGLEVQVRAASHVIRDR